MGEFDVLGIRVIMVMVGMESVKAGRKSRWIVVSSVIIINEYFSVVDVTMNSEVKRISVRHSVSSNDLTL